MSNRTEKLTLQRKINSQLKDRPREHVTRRYIQSRIKNKTFTRVDETVTICNLTLDNGFSVRGETASVYIENFNKEVGEAISYDDALRKLKPLFGFLLAENGTLKKVDKITKPPEPLA